MVKPASTGQNGEVLRFNTDDAGGALADGDLGMDITTGRPFGALGELPLPLAFQSEIPVVLPSNLWWNGGAAVRGTPAPTEFPTWNDAAPNPINSNAFIPITRNGTLRNLFVLFRANSLDGPTIITVFTLNLGPTALTLLYPAGASIPFSDTINTVAVLAGDFVYVEVDPSASFFGSFDTPIIGIEFL